VEVSADVVAVVLFAYFCTRYAQTRAQGIQGSSRASGIDCTGPLEVVPFRCRRSATSRLLDRAVMIVESACRRTDREVGFKEGEEVPRVA